MTASTEVLVPTFKSPPRKIIPFLYRSREKLRNKYKAITVKFRNLERRYKYAANKIEIYKEEISRLEGKVAQQEKSQKKHQKII